MARYWALFVLMVVVQGCTTVPKGLQPVADFDLKRYLGTWHEIARLDHGFERGMSHVTAAYSLRDDGGVKVVNRGYLDQEKEFREAVGRAYFIGEPIVGSLKVSFFWPFYGGYHIIDLDRDHYEWSVVSGPSKDYLWILARERHLDPGLLDRLVKRLAAQGFATDRLIYVRQD